MKNTTRKFIWILIANAFLIGFIAVVWQAKIEAATTATPVKLVLQGDFKKLKITEKPKDLPANATYLAGLEKSVPLQNFKGQWTILNLWATWCAPCVLELPSLQKLADAYARAGVQVVAISLDNPPSVAKLKEDIARAKLSNIKIAQNWDDKGEVADNLWPEGIPTTYIINPAGQIIATFEGDADWFSADAKAFVESLR
jgi:thiol-disulfide isomerase/thioredoxin